MGMDRPKKRVFVSVPRDSHLSDGQKALKQAILELLREKDIEPQGSTFPACRAASPIPLTLSAKPCPDVMARL